MLLIMHQVFSSLLRHLPFSVHFFIPFYGVTFFGTPNNKSNRTTMRPLGTYFIGISIYIVNMIHFLMISGDFGGFFKMRTDGHTDGWTDGRMDGWTDLHIEMRGRI